MRSPGSGSTVLREADAIARAELTAAGLDRDIWQFPVVLLADIRSVGVQGDGRTYGHPIVLRPVTSEDAMTADWGRLPYEVLEQISTRITNEVDEVNRVVLDITSKPPAHHRVGVVQDLESCRRAASRVRQCRQSPRPVSAGARQVRVLRLMFWRNLYPRLHRPTGHRLEEVCTLQT